MVQQYMMENQVLKGENNELKSEIDRLKSELAAKNQQKEDITQEVLRYLMNQNANTRGSNSYAQIYPKMEQHLIPPVGIPYSPQSLQVGHYMQTYPPDQNVVYSPSFPRIESVDSSPNTPALFKRVQQKKSRIPKHIQERNREIDRLSRINRSAQSDIDEINKQIQMYKKMNRTQRLPR